MVAEADYQGPPLLSMEKRIADGLGLKVGDTLTVNVLGRNISARIANLRVVDWQTLGINFVLVYSPNAFAGAPHTHIATLTFPGDTTAEQDAVILRKPWRRLSGGHHRAGQGRPRGGRSVVEQSCAWYSRGEPDHPDRGRPCARRRTGGEPS